MLPFPPAIRGLIPLAFLLVYVIGFGLGYQQATTAHRAAAAVEVEP